ncbi:MAG TPA: Wzz/FepE/Etk N-terminal domain-containing protein [Trueperaceae bacterium]|nr:Wzz/FepE/Etk N-terminal domain-containing protein [Trueperaceae bacterium]
MYDTRDEISLRELYLILRGGFAAIVIVTIIVGGAAFVYLSSKPARYEAAATVQVVAPQPSTTGDLANLIPQVALGTQAYTSLANSSSVLHSAFPNASNDPDELRRLSGSLELKAIDASDQARGQLTLEHKATADTAQEAARRANAWASASAAAAVGTMRETVDAAVASSTRQVEARKAALDQAQAAWAEFSKDDARAALRSQLDQLALQQAATRSRLNELDGQIAANAAQQALLIAATAARGGTSSSSLATQLRALVDAGALPEDAATGLREALSQLPPGATSGGQDLVNLVSRARLETVTAELAGQVAERAELRAGADQAEAEGVSLRARLSDLEERAAAPQTALNVARVAYDRVASVMPLLSLQQAMVADAAHVIIAAAPPLRPTPTNRLTITIAAALVAGLLATILVFLRAAVADTSPPKGVARRATEIDEKSGTLTHHDEDLLSVGKGDR